jgi:hypothetical protein
LWNGKREEAEKAIQEIALSPNEEKRDRQEVAVKNCLKYFQNQKEGIVDYNTFRMHGYFVGSGFIEKRNDTLIKNRMVRQKRMRWGREGGEAMMNLLAARMNGRLAEVFV